MKIVPVVSIILSIIIRLILFTPVVVDAWLFDLIPSIDWDFFGIFEYFFGSGDGVGGFTELPNRILIEFDDNVAREDVQLKAQEVAAIYNGKVIYTYEKVLKGALIELSSNDEDEVMTRGILDGTIINDFINQFVSTIHPDRQVGTYLEEEPNVQLYPPRGLDRIDQSGFPLDSKYYYKWDGTGVEVYVLDTGIRITHTEFEPNRAKCGFTAFPPEDADCSTEVNCTDARGHGTHVAGTIAGKTYGVAKNANVIAVKVLDDDGGGSDGTIIAGVDYVAKQKELNPGVPMVINMSLGGGRSAAMERAVNNAVDAGVFVVAAAGNQDTWACYLSPGGSGKVTTVGATDFSTWYNGERRAGYSNWGWCVDIFAPGSGIASASGENDSGSRVLSGTSMAAPHVAGAAALLLQQDPSMSPKDVRNVLNDRSFKNKLARLVQKLFSPNRLLNTLDLKV